MPLLNPTAVNYHVMTSSDARLHSPLSNSPPVSQQRNHSQSPNDREKDIIWNKLVMGRLTMMFANCDITNPYSQSNFNLVDVYI